MAAESSPLLPGAVLFACNFNRVRSPMAEALLRRVLGDRIHVDSCGLKRAPDGETVDPFVHVVMAEIGSDVSDYRSKTFDDLEDTSFDLIVSLTPESQHRAADFTRNRSTQIEYWPTYDPTLAEGSREARLEAYRGVRDALATRIAERFGVGVTAPGDA
jgi:protein-tyrosine-phosphatase